MTQGIFDETRDDVNDRVGGGGSPWAALKADKEGRLGLPVVESVQVPGRCAKK